MTLSFGCGQAGLRDVLLRGRDKLASKFDSILTVNCNSHQTFKFATQRNAFFYEALKITRELLLQVFNDREND